MWPRYPDKLWTFLDAVMELQIPFVRLHDRRTHLAGSFALSDSQLRIRTGQDPAGCEGQG